MSLVSIINMQCPIGVHHKHGPGPGPVLEYGIEKLLCQLCTVNPLKPVIFSHRCPNYTTTKEYPFSKEEELAIRGALNRHGIPNIVSDIIISMGLLSKTYYNPIVLNKPGIIHMGHCNLECPRIFMNYINKEACQRHQIPRFDNNIMDRI